MKYAHAAFLQGQEHRFSGYVPVCQSMTSRHFVDTLGPGGVRCLRCSANATPSGSMVFTPGDFAEGACRRFIAQRSGLSSLLVVQHGTKTAAHAALACPTGPHLRTDNLFAVCSLFPSVTLMPLFCSAPVAWLYAFNAKLKLQHVMHATGLACRHYAAPGQGALVAAGVQCCEQSSTC